VYGSVGPGPTGTSAAAIPLSVKISRENATAATILVDPIYRDARGNLAVPMSPPAILCCCFAARVPLLADRPPEACGSSLTRYGDAETLLGADEVVGILGVGDVDLHPFHLAVERAGTRCIVVADRGAGVLAEVGGLVGSDIAIP